MSLTTDPIPDGALNAALRVWFGVPEGSRPLGGGWQQDELDRMRDAIKAALGWIDPPTHAAVRDALVEIHYFVVESTKNRDMTPLERTVEREAREALVRAGDPSVSGEAGGPR